MEPDREVHLYPFVWFECRWCSEHFKASSADDAMRLVDAHEPVCGARPEPSQAERTLLAADDLWNELENLREHWRPQVQEYVTRYEELRWDGFRAAGFGEGE